MSPPRTVVVCGAGVIGASVAYFLARRGVAVTVVERSGVACAASGKSGGFLALDWCDGSPLEGLARASFALHAELARELGADYGYRRMDTFMMAARERGTPAGGHRVDAPRWIDGAGVVTGALGSTETTAQVHPARFTAALIAAAQSRGSELRIGVVEGVVKRDGAACGVTVDGRTVEADVVVLAMGPWTGRVGGLELPAVRGLKGCTDVDLGCSPSTNTLPIRRLRLAIGASHTIQAAWVRFPELVVVKTPQTYARLDESTYRYASGTFEADLTVDEDGLVAQYAEWRRTGFSVGPDDTEPLDTDR